MLNLKKMNVNKVIKTLYTPKIMEALPDIQEATIKAWLRSAYEYGYQKGQIDTIDRLCKKISIIDTGR